MASACSARSRSRSRSRSPLWAESTAEVSALAGPEGERAAAAPGPMDERAGAQDDASEKVSQETILEPSLHPDLCPDSQPVGLSDWFELRMGLANLRSEAQNQLEWIITKDILHDVKLAESICDSYWKMGRESVSFVHFSTETTFLATLDAVAQCVSSHHLVPMKHTLSVIPAEDVMELGDRKSGPEIYAIAAGPRSALMFTAKYVFDRLPMDYGCHVRLPEALAGDYRPTTYYQSGGFSRADFTHLLLCMRVALGGGTGEFRSAVAHSYLFDPTDLDSDRFA